MNKIFLLILIASIIAGIYFLTRNTPSHTRSSTKAPPISPNNSPTPANIHYQAKFAVYTFGTFRIFSLPRYHNVSPDVYITADKPNTIQVKKRGTTWGDFFNSLPMGLTNECLITGTKDTLCSGTNGSLRFFVNDKEVSDFVNKEIKNGDKGLVTYGNSSAQVIKSQLNNL